MSRVGKRTPKRVAAARAALEAGKGLRAAAKAAGVSHETIRSWELAKGSKRQGRTGARPSTAATDATVAALVATPLPTAGDPNALATAVARAAIVRGLIERLTPAVEADEYPATSFVTLARYADEVDRVVAELTPPAPKNPDDDVRVLEAERTLLARIEAMVVEAEGVRR